MKILWILLFITVAVTARTQTKNSSPGNIAARTNASFNYSEYSVHRYGAVGDGITDDSKAIQAAINANCTHNGGMIEFSAGKVYKAGGLIIPNFTAGYMPQFYIRGNGATITASADIIISKVVTGQVDAQLQVNSKIIIDGIRFIGNAKGTAVKIQATYGSEINRCYFINFDKGLDLQFCLAAKIFQCHGQGNISNDFLIQSGTWKGATTSNSQCNATVFEQCRTYCKAGQLASIKILASSGVVIRDCIIEGFDPVKGIEFDVQKSTTVKHFFIDNLHLECTPSEAGIYLNPWGGSCEIKSYWSQKPHVMIKTAYTGQGHIIIDNLQYIPPGATFSGEACMWYFKNMNWQIDPGGVKFAEFYRKHWSGPVPFYKSIMLDNGVFEDSSGKYMKSSREGIILMIFIGLLAIFYLLTRSRSRTFISSVLHRAKKKSNEPGFKPMRVETK